MQAKILHESFKVWAWLATLAVVLVILGGSSRDDAAQIIALRPMTALFLLPALFFLQKGDLTRARGLLILLGLLAIWMAIQLVPLPPSLWPSLPRRDLIADIDHMAGLEGISRSIAWVPWRASNALASLIVPLSGLMLALALRAKSRTLLLIIVAIGSIDALLGLVQVISGRTSVLYFYAVTNLGAPVGIFANENHSALLSCITMLTVAYLGSTSTVRGEPAWLRLAYPPVYLMALLAALVSGSRAGLVFVVLALVGSAMMLWGAIASNPRKRRRGKFEKWLAMHPRAVIAVMVATIVALIGGFLTLERAPGFEDLFAQNAFEDMRWRLWPALQQMLDTFWVVGIGFGSFEEVYHLFETTDMLAPSYINQAHNDWAQLVIEGGVPSVVILAGLLLWIAASLLKLRNHSTAPFSSIVFWVMATVMICVASLVDYPLRTPTFQLVGTWLLLALALERQNQTS